MRAAEVAMMNAARSVRIDGYFCTTNAVLRRKPRRSVEAANEDFAVVGIYIEEDSFWSSL
jgi:hypothetical protein